MKRAFLLTLLACGGTQEPAAPPAGERPPGSEKAEPEAAPAADAPAGAPAAPAAAALPPAGTVVTLGTLKAVEQGDYLHVVVTVAGEDHDHWCLDEACEALVDKPDLIGKPVELHWINEEIDVPEAGGKMKVRRVKSAKAGG
jgi:hypothetical protein